MGVKRGLIGSGNIVADRIVIKKTDPVCRKCGLVEMDDNKFRLVLRVNKWCKERIHVGCLRVKREVVVKERVKRVCKKCGGEEVEGNLFRRVMVNGVLRSKGYHLSCWYNERGNRILGSVKWMCDVVGLKRSVKVRVCKRCGFPPSVGNEFTRGGVIHEGCRVKVNKNRVPVDERLPERKVCVDCGENKHISEYYIDKNSSAGPLASNRCKKCHLILTRGWALRHRDEVLAYLREYHKTYKRKPPKNK